MGDDSKIETARKVVEGLGEKVAKLSEWTKEAKVGTIDGYTGSGLTKAFKRAGVVNWKQIDSNRLRFWDDSGEMYITLYYDDRIFTGIGWDGKTFIMGNQEQLYSDPQSEANDRKLIGSKWSFKDGNDRDYEFEFGEKTIDHFTRGDPPLISWNRIGAHVIRFLYATGSKVAYLSFNDSHEYRFIGIDWNGMQIIGERINDDGYDGYKSSHGSELG